MASPVVRRFLRVVVIGSLVGAAAGIIRAVRRKPAPPTTGSARWEPLREPEAPGHREGPVRFAAVPEPAPEPAGTWVEPVDGACPATHPIKGNADSGIFHVPGGMSYERTIPERCYATAADAEADGFRQAKR